MWLVKKLNEERLLQVLGPGTFLLPGSWLEVKLLSKSAVKVVGLSKIKPSRCCRVLETFFKVVNIPGMCLMKSNAGVVSFGVSWPVSGGHGYR